MQVFRLFYSFILSFLLLTIGSSLLSFFTAQCSRWIYRAPRSPHSYCFACQSALKWYDLFPIWSFLCLRGKCRYCHSAIPSYHLFGEVLAGFWTLLLYFTEGLCLHSLIEWVVALLLLTTSMIDWMVLAVPDRFWGLLALLLLFSPFPHHYLAMLATYGCLWLLSLSLKGGLGGADIKAFSLLALCLPFYQLLFLLVFSSGGALLFQLFHYYRKGHPIQELPFLPFICLGLFGVHLFFIHSL